MQLIMYICLRFTSFSVANIMLLKMYYIVICAIVLPSRWAVVGLMNRALDLKPEVTQGCGFESRLRQEVHDCSPGAAQSAAHCSKCVHLDGLNAENTFHSSLYSV